MHMKFLLSSLLAVIVLGSAPGVKAAQIWVNGVTTESGWIDYDKSWDGDTLLCWAASASCVLDYWQSLYLTSSTVPTGAAIWERYKEAADDKLGNALLGIQWWIGGDYAGTTIKDNDQTNNRAEYYLGDYDPIAIKTDFNNFDGYYWDVIPDTNGGKIKHLEDFLWLYDENSKGVDITSAIIDQLSQAPISMGIRGGGLVGHAITLWGVEYTESNDGKVTITSMWITDSDDSDNQLRKLEVNYKNNDTKLYLDSYKGTNGTYLAGIYGLNVAESDTWALQRIPEPVTTTLSIAALVALCGRRRRRI